jgi:hypothetical protein
VIKKRSFLIIKGGDDIGNAENYAKAGTKQIAEIGNLIGAGPAKGPAISQWRIVGADDHDADRLLAQGGPVFAYQNRIV